MGALARNYYRMKIYIPAFLFLVALTLSSSVPVISKRAAQNDMNRAQGRFLPGVDLGSTFAGFGLGFGGGHLLNSFNCQNKQRGRNFNAGVGLGIFFSALTNSGGC